MTWSFQETLAASVPWPQRKLAFVFGLQTRLRASSPIRVGLACSFPPRPVNLVRPPGDYDGAAHEDSHQYPQETPASHGAAASP